jgi:hypothetical protein
MKPLYFAALVFLLFLSSFSDKNAFRDYTPPGTIKVDRNFYVDQTEVRNLDYLEFLYWTKKVYGASSKEYLSALPDTSVWKSLGKKYETFCSYYLSHPAYRNNPVVGINFEQAKAFANWRSDRVMELILIREGVLKYNPAPKKDSLFTIRNYFEGRYGTFRKEEYLQYYPVYSLPDTNDYKRILIFTDSLNTHTLSKARKKEEIRKMTDPYFFENIPNKNDTLPYGTDATRAIPFRFYNQSFFRSESKKLVLDVLGNVAEITASGLCFGGSYKENKTENRTMISGNSLPDCYTGFRNICRFKSGTGIIKLIFP